MFFRRRKVRYARDVMLCTDRNSPDAWSSGEELVRGKANTGNIVVGFCYRSSGQEDKIDETFSRQVEEVPVSQALTFTGYTN